MKTLREYIDIIDGKNINEDWRKKAGPLGAAIGGTIGAIAGGVPGAISGAVGGGAAGYGIQKEREKITNTKFYKTNLLPVTQFITLNILNLLPQNKWEQRVLTGDPRAHLEKYINHFLEEYFIEKYGKGEAFQLLKRNILDPSTEIEGVDHHLLVSTLKADIRKAVKKNLKNYTTSEF